MSRLKSHLICSSFAVALSITFFDRFLNIIPVHGRSMSPTLSPDYHATGRVDLLLVRKFFPNRNLQIGDIVCFWTPHDPDKLSIKKITALEGDTVIPRYSRSLPYDPLISPSGTSDLHKSVTKVTIPRGHMWVEGENVNHSRDSNQYGAISQSLIWGKATHIVWPPSRFRSLSHRTATRSSE